MGGKLSRAATGKTLFDIDQWDCDTVRRDFAHVLRSAEGQVEFNMTPTASRTRKRSIALAMLLVWVFALLSGVANACLTEPRGDPVHAGSHAAQLDHRAQASTHSHGEVSTQHDQRADKASCQKSCDESAQMLVKPPPKFDAPDLQAVVVPAGAWSGGLHGAREVLARTVMAAVLPPAPPPRVQFSRLAL